MEKQKGVALILAIGILAVFSIFATSFTLNMRLEYKIAKNYNNRVKARYIAYAALQKAIAELRENVKVSAFDFPARSTSSISSIAADDVGSGNVTIKDEQGKFNVNNCTQDALEKLIRYLITYKAITVKGLSVNDAKKIMDIRPASGFSQLEDIIVQSKIAGGGAEIEATILKALRPYITVYGYEDPSYMNRSPVNINSASRPVIAAAVETAIPSANRDTIWMVAWGLRGQQFSSWADFNNAVDAMTSLTENEKTAIKDDINPNGTPSSMDVVQCCLHPGGYYGITAGGVTSDSSSAQTVSAVAKISEMYVETTKGQFANGTTVDTTVADNCPDYPSTIPRTDYVTPGSIKLGLWDDFDEDVCGVGWTASTGSFNISDVDGDGDKELVQTSNYGLFIPPIKAENFYLNLFREDLGGGTQMKNVAWVLFRGTGAGSPVAIQNKAGMLEWGGAWAYDTGGGNIQFFTNAEAAANGFVPGDRYVYPAAVRLWPDDNQDIDVNRDLIGYDANRSEFRVMAFKNVALVKARFGGTYTNFSRSDIAENTGSTDIGLYGCDCKIAWDDVRIITPTGSFTSQTFSPPEGSVIWGTITGTLTNSNQGDVTLSAVTGAGAASPPQISLGSSDPYVAIGGSSNSIYWNAAFAQTGLSSIWDTIDCPILEDVTITYLPKTQLVSYVTY